MTVVRVLDVHALLRRAAELEEALAELVAGQLVDRAHAAVAEVVDVVDLALAGAQLDAGSVIALTKSSGCSDLHRPRGTSVPNLRLMRKRPTRPRR